MWLGLLLCLCLPPAVWADIKQCPLGDSGGVPNATCLEGTTCAMFDGRQPKCTGWVRFRCASREYRNMQTCQCMACPTGTGRNCDSDNECCSLSECGAAETPKPKPLGLSSTSRLAPHTPAHAVLLLWLLLMLF